MRYTQKVSVWPVGLVGYLRYERPVVKNHKVSSISKVWVLKCNKEFLMFLYE